MKTESQSLNTLEAKVFSHGTIKLPAALRHELSIHDSDKVLFIRKGDSWIVTTHQNNIKTAQELIKSLNKNNISLVDELLKDRHDEVLRESN